MKMTGAEIIIEVLVEQGVTELFGYPGGSALNIYEALYNGQNRIKHYLTAHEQGATHAADGYARSTGKTGVVVATSGPGSTNTVTGIATAYLDSIPMVVITSNVGTSLIGKDSFQEVFITGITQPITKHNYAVRDISLLADTIREAFKIAGSGRKGPVLVDVPKDITAALWDYTPAPKWENVKQLSASEEELQKVADALKKAKRPVICFGGGIISADAAETLVQFIKKTQVPACHTIMGTGVIGFGDELDMGIIGMHGSLTANRAIDECDLLIAMAMRFSDRVALKLDDFAPHAKIIHMDIDDSEISKNVSADFSVVGDIGAELARLSEMVGECGRSEWLKTIGGWRADDMDIYNQGFPGIRPAEIFEVIGDECGVDAIVATDVGQHQIWAAQFCKKTKPRGFLTSGGLGTMGYGYGAALGAQVGNPDAKVFHITSDGSFHMNMNEACTAVSYELPVISVILDNKVLGMVYQWQTSFYNKHYIATTVERKSDYIKLAEGFGAKGYMAETKEEFQAVLKKALAERKPTWIVCPTDRRERVLPMISSGETVREAITE